MNTQQKWAIGGAVLGAAAALTGKGSNTINEAFLAGLAIDAAISAALFAAIAYPIGLAVANRKKN